MKISKTSNMKKIIILSLTIVLAFSFTSCDDFLDVKPAGKLIPAEGDVVSYDRLLNNINTIRYVFHNSNGGSNLPYLTDDVQISDNQAEASWIDGHPNIDCYYSYIYQTPYANPAVHDTYWNSGFYKAAQYFNSCIDGVKDVITKSTEAYGKEIIAQATVARAWGYFTAALAYGPVYKPNGDNSTKVLPYRTKSSITASMEDLSTLQEIYDRVLSDIHSSLPYIPEQTASNTRFGKVQTYAFLAYYHLFTCKYDSVAYYANKSLEQAAANAGGMENLFYDMNKFSWARAELVLEDPDNREGSRINTTEGEDAVTSTWMREIALYRQSANISGYKNAYPSEEYKALFDTETDLRSEYFIFENVGFKGTLAGTTYDDDRQVQAYQDKIARTSGYTYPEILLMRAEGYARTGKTAEALADLNYLRKFRHKTGTPDLTLSGADEIMNEIANERRREIHIGSYKRFADLKRYTNDAGKPWSKSEISHTVQGTTYKASIDSEYFVLPISNEVLRWNEHWGIPLNEAPWSNIKKN